MTMYDLETISQFANSLYQSSIPAVRERELPKVLTGPDQDGPVQERNLDDGPEPAAKPMAAVKVNSATKPHSGAGPGVEPVTIRSGHDDYYFLRNHPVRNTVVTPTHPGSPAWDAATIRRDFPILETKVNGHPLIWFDNAATTQKPLPVIDALGQFYREINSNVHRGAHTLAGRATEAYETAREKVQRFIGASSSTEVIFVRGTTEAINLVAQSYGRMNLGKGDEILISVMEHHSNIVPWQLLSQQTGANIRPIPISDRGEILLGEYEKLLSPRTRLVAITQVSNVLGTINPVRLMTEMAHYYGARVMIDGAQAVPHVKVDVKLLDADFYTFSGHKLYGPTGIGVLYGKRDLLEEMPPWQGGGGMIDRVDFEETTFNRLPHKFEAGTVNIADAVGLGEAVDYLQQIGLPHIEHYEQKLTGYATNLLSEIPDLHLFGTPQSKVGVISFIIQDVPSEDIARFLDKYGIAVRAGHHCAQPLMKHYGRESMVRVSFGLYNTQAEVNRLAGILRGAARGSR